MQTRRLGQALVFCKIRAALGIMSTIISGGGSLAPHLDDFFEVRQSSITAVLSSPSSSIINYSCLVLPQPCIHVSCFLMLRATWSAQA
jgi:hypothetical protein